MKSAAQIPDTSTPDGGRNPGALTNWLTRNVPGAVPPFETNLIAAGGSNLTYQISDSQGSSWALRRPPMAHNLATAHDMSREWRIQSALASHPDIPVPECVAFCGTADVGKQATGIQASGMEASGMEASGVNIMGAPFYIMSFVDGLILRDQKSTANMTRTDAARATESLVNIQVALHTLDLEAVGLADLGQHHNYVGRQLKRWRRQVLEGGVRDLPLHGELHQRLLDAMPPETTKPALAHGDYRFDNCVLGEDFSVSAVLDWELCTTGNPVADFVWSLQYWADPEDDFTFLVDPPTLNTVFSSRDSYRQLYESKSGFDLSDLPYYQVFSWWKQASIVEGAYARRLAGATGGMGTGSDVHEIAKRVDTMLTQAADWAQNIL